MGAAVGARYQGRFRRGQRRHACRGGVDRHRGKDDSIADLLPCGEKKAVRSPTRSIEACPRVIFHRLRLMDFRDDRDRNTRRSAATTLPFVREAPVRLLNETPFVVSSISSTLKLKGNLGMFMPAIPTVSNRSRRSTTSQPLAQTPKAALSDDLPRKKETIRTSAPRRPRNSVTHVVAARSPGSVPVSSTPG